MLKKNITHVELLYDEFGSATFSEEKENNIYLGVSVLYDTEMMDGLFERCSKNANFDIFVDNRSISPNDEDVELKFRSQSANRNINDMLRELSVELFVNVSPITMLVEDSKRKRFIDIITSVISRQFQNNENTRFDSSILKRISNDLYDFTDVTQEIKDSMLGIMDRSARHGWGQFYGSNK